MDLDPYSAKVKCFSEILLRVLASFDDYCKRVAEEDSWFAFRDPVFVLSQLLQKFGDDQISWLAINGQCLFHERLGYCGAVVEMRVDHLHINLVNRASSRRQCNFLLVARDGKPSQWDLNQFAHASREIYVKAEYIFSQRAVKVSWSRKGGDINKHMVDNVEDWYEHIWFCYAS